MARTRQNVEQLAELLDGGVGAEGASAELAQLAALARSLPDNVQLATPTPAFREALRTQILTAPIPAAAPATTDLSPSERIRRFVEERSPDLVQTGRAAAATATAAAIVATGGVGTLAQQALPGDLLYPVKDATENLRLAFTGGELERGQLHLQFAQERLEELEEGVGRLTSDLIAETLGRLDDEAIAAANELLAALAATGDLTVVATLHAFTADAGGRLTDLRDLVPAEVAGRVDDSLEVLRRIDIQADVAAGIADACDCDPARAVIGPQHDSVILRPGEGPAVPRPACDCVNRPTPGGTAVTPTPEPTPTPTETTEPPTDPVEPTEPVSEDPETVPTLPSPVDPVGDQVEQIVDDLLEQLPVNPVEDLPEPAQDLRREVNDGVGEVSKTVDDILPSPLR